MDMKVDRDLIKELRLNNSWSQEKLAEEAGLSMRTVQRIESEGIASLQSRKAVADALGVKPSQLSLKPEKVEFEHEAEPGNLRLTARSAPLYYLLCIARVFLISASWLCIVGTAFSVITTPIFFFYFWELTSFSQLQSTGLGIVSSILIAPFYIPFRWAYKAFQKIEVVIEPVLSVDGETNT